jgi:glutamine synthetase
MTTLDDIARLVGEHGIHTVEVATPDSYGHLRGKRVPADRFLRTVAGHGVHIADAIFVFDIACDIVDSPFINMDTGYLDCHLQVDLGSFRVLTHRPGYGIVFADALDPSGEPHSLAPRAVLARQVERLAALGHHAMVATELEAYICTDDWQPVQPHVQYSSLTDAPALEELVVEMRDALLGAGIPLESSNPEYGPGQLEINFGPADPVRTADNTALFKSIIKELATRRGLRATFMPKPWADQSGSGMHIHTSLGHPDRDGANAFGDSHEAPNALMAAWTAGMLANASAMSLIMIPTPNGYKRVRPYTFAPTHVHWGDDNRTVLARLTLGAEHANRVEFRSAGADANPYLAIAAVLAAGCDGLEQSRELQPKAVGDQYTNPGEHEALPLTIEAAIDAYRGSALAAGLGEQFSENFVVLAEAEAAKYADAVTDWERRRYMEFS